MSLGWIPKTICGCCRKPFLCSPIRTPVNIPFLFYFFLIFYMLLYLLFIKSSLPSYPLIICHVLRPSQQVSFLMRSQTYLVEQWESLEEIKFNHRAKINTKVFFLSGVLREGSFYFGQGTLGSLKKMGPFGPYFW